MEPQIVETADKAMVERAIQFAATITWTGHAYILASSIVGGVGICIAVLASLEGNWDRAVLGLLLLTPSKMLHDAGLAHRAE